MMQPKMINPVPRGIPFEEFMKGVPFTTTPELYLKNVGFTKRMAKPEGPWEDLRYVVLDGWHQASDGYFVLIKNENPIACFVVTSKKELKDLTNRG